MRNPFSAKIPGLGKIFFFAPYKNEQQSETDSSDDNVHAKFQLPPQCGKSNAEK